MTGELKPIAEAFGKALAAQEAEAARAAEAEQKRRDREEDGQSIIRTYNRYGLKKAKGMGRTYGWSADEVTALCEPPPAAPPDGGEDAAAPPAGPPPGEDAKWRKRKNPVKPLRADCPVQPLGTQGGIYWYLNPLNELRELKKHGPDELRSLFASRGDYLWDAWPKFKENGDQSGWDAAGVAESLTTAAGKAGVFNPARMLRGRGAWTDDLGNLVLHCGDAIWVDGAWEPPGRYGGNQPVVYPGMEPVPRPADDADGADADMAAARRLLDLYASWNWRWGEHPETPDKVYMLYDEARVISPAALMLLGHTGCDLVCGALDWRPMVWVTGDAGTGKSTLLKIKEYIEGGRLLASADATAAGISQTVGYSALAVAIDEAEADPHSTRMKAMVELVRASASGALKVRGSPGAQVHSFTLRSSFQLSSILVPPLFTQDLSRIAQLDLGPLTGHKPPKIDPQALRHMGRRLLRRIIEQWPTWTERLDIWRTALAGIGHDARGCDQYGTLFAMADLLLHDGLPAVETADFWAGYTGHVIARAHQGTNADTMLGWLLTKPVDNVFRGGQQYTIRSLAAAAAGLEDIDGGSPATCLMTLRERGIIIDVSEGNRDKARVFLPNAHAGLARLLEGSPWGTMPGAKNSGWSQAMARLPGAASGKKFGARGWSVPIGVFLMMEG